MVNGQSESNQDQLDLNDRGIYDYRSARNYGASWTVPALLCYIRQLQEHIVENTWYNENFS